MKGKKLVVAALLLTTASKVAAAADSPEHESQHAEKLLASLDILGINDPTVRSFVSEMDTHVEKGFFSLGEERIGKGAITLHYQLETDKSDPLRVRGGGLNKMELKYTPDDSNFETVARPDRVMMNYTLHF